MYKKHLLEVTVCGFALSMLMLITVSHAYSSSPDIELSSRRVISLGSGFYKKVESFAGKARMHYYLGAYVDDRKVKVSDRIIDGLQAAVSKLVLHDGTTLYWGFRHQEATTESVVVFDSSGRVRMLAAVDTILWCDGDGCDPIEHIQKYQALRSASQGRDDYNVAVYVRKENDLEAYLPHVKRWIQAKLLGLGSCQRQEMNAACDYVGKLDVAQFIPIRAFLLPSMKVLPIPAVTASTVPLSAFDR